MNKEMSNKKYNTGLVASTFDLFHTGHVLILKEAKELCDYVIVGLQTDPTVERKEKNKPIQSLFERYIQVQGCKYVDEIFVYTTEKDLEYMIKQYKIDVRIKGSDWKNKIGVTDHLFDKIHYHDRSQYGFSSSELRERIKNAK